MSIPDYQSIMLPVLRFMADGGDHTRPEATEFLATKFALTLEERNELLPSGKGPRFRSRVGWAITYLKKAGLLESSRRGVFRITAHGKEIINENPERIDRSYLRRFPEFVEFLNISRASKEEMPETETPDSLAEETPRESLETACQTLRASLAQDILDHVLSCSPAFFERLVVELLVNMGYGGSRRDAGKSVGRSGDGGIDGSIKEDRLGLDAIYIQAKRWQNPIGRPEIQKFVGALQGQRAKKGVFITTSSFTPDAIDYASRVDTKVVLVDGKQIADLMIDFDVGVSVEASYVVKRIDSDYFEENEDG